MSSADILQYISTILLNYFYAILYKDHACLFMCLNRFILTQFLLLTVNNLMNMFQFFYYIADGQCIETTVLENISKDANFFKATYYLTI